MSELIIEQEAEGLDIAATRRGVFSHGGLRRWVRLGALMATIVVALPVVLTILYLPPIVRPISTLMIKDLITLQGYNRQWVSLDDIAPVMAHSVIMSEDGQFCSHKGIDLDELLDVIKDALEGETTRGASTIPMQTVKNLYLWNSRSFLRKVVELPLAIYFDALMPKKRVMEIYLNIAEWGPNIYGVGAASQHYFGKPASQLSGRQAALLAVALPNPVTRNPAKPGLGLKLLVSAIERRVGKAVAYVQCLD